MVTKEEVKNAVEYKWRGNQVKTYLVLWAAILLLFPVCMAVSLVLSGFEWDAQGLGILGTALAVVAGVYSLAVLPFAVYAAYCQWQMLQHCKSYERHWVKLDEPNTSWNYRQAIGYRVVFEREGKGKIARYTKPVFSGSAFSQFPLSDYNNKTVEIFYDPERDEVILVGNAK